jgi:uncharacterized protein YkwD
VFGSRFAPTFFRFCSAPLRLPRGLAVAAAITLGIAATPAAQAKPADSAAPAAAAQLAPYSAGDQLLALMNQARASYGEQPLTLVTDVDWVAESRALDMAQNGYFDHYNAEGVGALQLLNAYQVQYGIMGENIARTTQPSSYPLNSLVPAIHNALMASEHHRENVLDARFTQVGVAVAVENGEYYFAVVFTD